MCVTNTANRRPVSLAPSVVAPEASLISQRLLGPLFPAFDSVVKNASTTSTEIPKVFNDHFQMELPTGMVGYSKTEDDKQKPKRRRKPQKPGKTAKMNDRHFVVHNYHDHAQDDDAAEEEADNGERRRGGVSVAFPLKLHSVLDQVEADGYAHIISWQPHGRCFVVHKPKEFVDHIMPKYFRQTKLTSFQRQLNLYGFCRLTRGPDASGYYHELFLRGRIGLCKKMIRTKVKGTKFKAASSPEQEPDFYKMPPVVVTPNHSDNESKEPVMSVASAPSLSFDPLPVEQRQLPYAMMGSTFASLPMVHEQSAVAKSYADRILDEAVDELFFNDGNNDGLDDLRAWDLSNTFAEDSEIEDAQLGVLLEKLLEE